MRPLRAVGCENGGQGEGNPPGLRRPSSRRRGLGRAFLDLSIYLLYPPPNMALFTLNHCRDRRVAPCCAVCAQEGANERL
eukprot:scaffold32033_cov33-Phaeocystis_antarctica.AAC.1